MTEKDIKIKFVKEYLDKFKELIRVPNIRLYSMEFPVYTTDGIKYADIILETKYEDRSPMENPLMVLEFKKDKIDVGVCEQVDRYGQFIQRQLYRKTHVSRFIAGPDFSDYEKDLAKEMGIFCLQFDLRGNIRLVK